ncbi:unnamed protein product [Brassica rapa subsp. trilocularis]
MQRSPLRVNKGIRRLQPRPKHPRHRHTGQGVLASYAASRRVGKANTSRNALVLCARQ